MDELKKDKVLVVDDGRLNRHIAAGVLEKEYDLIFAENGQEAVDIVRKGHIDVIMMDVEMPIMDGFEATAILKADSATKNIPLIMVTTLSDKNFVKKALSLGADDYLVKPYDYDELRLRIQNMLRIKKFSEILTSENALLEERVRLRTKELRDAYELIKKNEHDIIELLCAAGETRDSDTGAHIFRVGYISEFLALKLGMADGDGEMIRYASMMHDIGKIGIPDGVLLKPGKLDYDEFEVMKKHSVIGYNILKARDIPLIKMAARIAVSHHEKWDGSGYPDGLMNEEIPIEGRIVAIVDVFDALMSDRPYKKAFSAEKTKEILAEGGGTHFDPVVAGLFLKHFEEILEIRSKYI